MNLCGQQMEGINDLLSNSTWKSFPSGFRARTIAALSHLNLHCSKIVDLQPRLESFKLISESRDQ